MKPYVVILFPTQSKAVVLDRKYQFITDDKAVWGKITLGQVIDCSKKFYAGSGIPQWAYDMEKKGYIHVALWLRPQSGEEDT